ncbi:hypothetical protein [Parabacteroides goldsteinii]|uniref:hypothetical protein n=1 Tax=Parabacteroides goldsteinii TaxID=328812 RepID=UPI00189FAE0F|nr:hypothetical protein [Parabacteroides goldsteinii]
MALQTLNFTENKEQGLFFSDSFILTNQNACVQIEVPEAGIICLQRSNDGITFYDVPFFYLTASDCFNITGGIEGQTLRVTSKVNPTKCTVLL